MDRSLTQFEQFKNNSKNFLKKTKKVLDIENELCYSNEVACESNTNRTLIIKQWNNPENSMNFHSNGWEARESDHLRNSKKTSKDERNKPLLFRNKKPE